MVEKKSPSTRRYRRTWTREDDETARPGDQRVRRYSATSDCVWSGYGPRGVAGVRTRCRPGLGRPSWREATFTERFSPNGNDDSWGPGRSRRPFRTLAKAIRQPRVSSPGRTRHRSAMRLACGSDSERLAKARPGSEIMLSTSSDVRTPCNPRRVAGFPAEKIHPASRSGPFPAKTYFYERMGFSPNARRIRRRTLGYVFSVLVF